MATENPATTDLPAIPAKRYFTIGEVSELCGVKPHVLRYWEQECTQLKPLKRRGNRRYYQHHEVLLIRRIRELLYEHGFTINGARNRLEEPGGASISAGGGHSWSDFGAASAIHALVCLAARLTQIDAPKEPRSSFNIGVIEGGSSVNTIAERASLLLDLRSTAPAALDTLIHQVENIVAHAREAEPGVTFGSRRN